MKILRTEGDGFEDDPFWNIDTLMPKGGRSLRGGKKPGKSAPADAKPAGTPGTSGVPGAPGVSGGSNAPGVPGVPGGVFPSGGGPVPPGSDVRAAQASGRMLAFSDTPERVYRHEDLLIRETAIYAWPIRYSFFSGFRRSALTVASLPVTEAPYTPFFSFMPQFHQLNAAQLKFYLWWRASFIAGKPLKTDFFYLQLFLYEIINLPDAIPPKKGADLLCELWITYRASYSKLDKYLSEWLCDYCLIHDVLPREPLFAQVCPWGRASGSFKEFFTTAEERAHPGLTLSTYTYKSGKYRTEENAALFDTHIPAAMDALFALLRKRAGGEDASPVELKITRSSFDGAVCAHEQKKRIDVSYTPLVTFGTPQIVTDAEKLCENYVRAALGIRARFPSGQLDEGMREAIEGYFAVWLPSSLTKKANEEYRYDERYEPKKQELSFDAAEEIERRSRGVAIRLSEVEHEDAAGGPSDPAIPKEAGDPVSSAAYTPSGSASETASETASEAAPDTAPDPSGSSRVCDGDAPSEEEYAAQYRAALKAIRDGGMPAFAAFAAGLGLLPHTLADEINEEALRRIGDVVLVGDDSGLELLPDYESEVNEWINSN